MTSRTDKKAILARLLKQKRRSYSFPLSHGQQALWFIHQQAPTSPAYNMAWLVNLQGELFSPALAQALKYLVARHPALRTTVAVQDGEPIQTVHPDGITPLTEHQATAWSEQKLDAAIQQAYEQPFTLSEGPVLRVDLFHQGTEQHVLLITMHHIFGDAASMNILGKELLTLCHAEQKGEKVLLPPLPASYADFVQEEAAALQSSESQKVLRYWREKLEGENLPLNLHTDYPRPAEQKYNGASIPYTLSSQLSEQLRILAKQEQTTLFCVIATALHILLHRYTGQSVIRIGTPSSVYRQDPRFADLIGYLINPIILQAHITPALSFLDLLPQTQQDLVSTLDHAAYPFPLVVKALQPKREPGSVSLFQVMLDFKARDFAPAGIPGLHIKELDMGQMEGQFDLHLTIGEGSQLSGRLRYNQDLFHPETVERMLTHFEVLLTAIASNPRQPISQLSIIPEQELEQLKSWNDTARDYPEKNLTLADLFESQVRKTPNRPALIFGKEQLSYIQLNRQANQLAHVLLMHVTKKDNETPLIALCLERSQEMVIGLLAILKAGYAYVPIDPEYPEERISSILDDCAAPLLLTLSHWKKTLPLADRSHDCQAFTLDEIDWSNHPQENPRISRSTNDPAYVIYTSGSTGQPKGAMNEQSGIVNRLLWMQERYHLTTKDAVLHKTTFCFDVSIWEIFWPLITGARLVLAKPGGHKDPSYLVKLIAEQQINTIHFVPSMLTAFLASADTNQCRSLKRVICSGEALLPNQVEQFYTRFAGFDTELHNLYGPTEAAIDVSFWQCSPEDATRTSIPIGSPVANTRLYVLDTRQQPVPVGVPGELYIAGIQVGRGYINRLELTNKAFFSIKLFGKPERVYKTRDRARWLSDGSLEYLGRLDHQVKVRGLRVELGEIESVLLQFPGVRACVVVMREIALASSRQLLAYVVMEQEKQNDTNHTRSLKEYLKKKLPEYMIPAIIMFLDTLPLTSNGKLDRKALPEPTLHTSDYICARDDVELRLIRLWEELLEISPITVQDDFFTIGGDSLLALRLLFHIRKEFGKELPLHTLLQNRSVEQLAALLRKDSPAPPWQPIICLQSQGDKLPLFFAHASGGSAFNALELASLMGKERPFYAIHPKGGEPGESFHASIEEMAADYLAALRSIQATGPYLMAGWSFGGTVIFEMARQLEQMGETVPLLIMIDAPEPTATVWKENDLEFLLDRVPYYHGTKIDGLNTQSSEEDKVAYLLNAIKMTGMMRPDIDQQHTQQWFAMYKQHNRLVGMYTPPSPVASRVLFFKPAERIPFDEQMGQPIEKWRPFIQGGIDVQELPGNHFTMLSPANTPALAAAMREYLKDYTATY